MFPQNELDRYRNSSLLEEVGHDKYYLSNWWDGIECNLMKTWSFLTHLLDWLVQLIVAHLTIFRAIAIITVENIVDLQTNTNKIKIEC